MIFGVIGVVVQFQSVQTLFCQFRNDAEILLLSAVRQHSQTAGILDGTERFQR